MTRFDRLILDGTRLNADIAERVVKARMRRTMKGASSIELTLNDHDGLVLSSGLLSRRGKPPKDERLGVEPWARFGLSRLVLDGWFLRLAGVEVEVGERVTVIFEDEIASIGRRLLGPLKASRADMTRLQFVRMMFKRSRVLFVVNSPEDGQRRPIKGDTPKERARVRERGIHPDTRLTIKGQRADREQIRNLEIILAVADEDNAGERATIAMLCAAIGESSVRAIMNAGGSGYGGVFQGDVDARYRYFEVGDTEEQAHYFLVGGKGFQQGGAKKLAAENPGMGAGEIATRVEASGMAPEFYGQWQAEAEKILDAYGGVHRVRVERRRYEFRVMGADRDADIPAENYWDASGRLLDEVRINRFAVENVLHLVSDEYLFGRRPVFIINRGRDTPGVLAISARADVGRPVSEVRVTADKPLWTGRPGNVMTLDGGWAGPLAGRWLIDEISEDLFDIEPAELVLRRPAPSLPEPAATRETSDLTETTPEAGSVRGAIVAAVKKALRLKDDYLYEQKRPMNPSLFRLDVTRPAPRTQAPIPVSEKLRMDCSEFATLAYKAAGAPDPNGRGYDGSGYTGTLAANGTKTNDPQPGDLAMYGSGPPFGHVAVYIGDGQCIGFGSDPIRQHAVRYRSDFYGFYRFDLG